MSGRNAFAFAVLAVFLFAPLAFASCGKVEPSTNDILVDVGSSNQVSSSLSVYVERNANSFNPCILEARVDPGSQGFVSVSPKQVIHEGNGYGIYSFTVTSNTAAGVSSGTVSNVSFIDRETNAKVFSVRVTFQSSDSRLKTVNLTIPGCEDPSEPGCEKPRVIRPSIPPGLIDESAPDIMFILPILAVFGLIVLLFFMAIRGN